MEAMIDPFVNEGLKGLSMLLEGSLEFGRPGQDAFIESCVMDQQRSLNLGDAWQRPWDQSLAGQFGKNVGI